MDRVPPAPSRLASLFASFEGNAIRWCLLRPAELLAQPEGDIDLLVAQEDLPRAANLLAAADFVLIRRDSENVHALDHDEETRRFLWIHLQSEIEVAGVHVGAPELRAGDRGGGLPQLPDGLMFWTLLLRALLQKGGVPLRQRPHLHRLASAAGSPPEALTPCLLARGWSPEQLVSLVREQSWESLDSLARRPPASDERRPAARLRRAALRAARGSALWRRAPRPDGMTVAILGPDGAGKTTLVASLSRSLPFPTRVQYLGLTGGRIPRAEALRVPGIVFLAKLAILWWRYLRGRYHKARGRIVLFERYVLDAAVPSGVKLRPVARASRRLLQWVLPLPDLVLLLDASGETMFRRSREYDADELERWRLAFRRLQRSVGQLEVLDAERPADVVLHDAAARIWRHYRTVLAET